MAETCWVCKEEFGGAADLLEHVRSHHRKELDVNRRTAAAPAAPSSPAVRRQSPFVCGLCGASFPSREQLAKHSLSDVHNAPPAPGKRRGTVRVIVPQA